MVENYNTIKNVFWEKNFVFWKKKNVFWEKITVFVEKKHMLWEKYYHITS